MYYILFDTFSILVSSLDFSLIWALADIGSEDEDAAAECPYEVIRQHFQPKMTKFLLNFFSQSPGFCKKLDLDMWLTCYLGKSVSSEDVWTGEN